LLLNVQLVYERLRGFNPVLIQIEIAYRLAGVGRFLGFAHGFLKLLFKQVRRVLLRLDRLPEDGIAPAVLLFHRPGSIVEIVEHLRLDWRNMRDYAFGFRIYLQHSAAAGASEVEAARLSHRRNDKSKRGVRRQASGPRVRIANRYTSAMAIDALFFDVGNTLLFPSREKMLRSLHARQIFPPEELLQQIERQTKREFDELVESHATVDHGFWWMFYTRLLRELGIPDESTCGDLVACTQISANWCEIKPGTREALLRLGKRYRMAVISNADGRIAEALARGGILDCFESVTDSGIIGKEKPHPAIFEAALRSLGAKPDSSLYIGDVYCVDYMGATSVGMQAVLFDVPGAYAEKSLPRVQSLEELEALLAKGS
jgi:FMN phosphatase YigB (HAD superfamily)